MTAVDRPLLASRARMPIDVWLILGDGIDGPGGATVVPLDRDDATSPFALLDVARAAGADDVRRIGIVCTGEREVELGRRAGLGAVVAVADDAEAATRLLGAEPDAVVTQADLHQAVDERWGSRARPLVLLNPGPGLTTAGVKRAAVTSDICHREAEYAQLDLRVREGVRRVAGVGSDWGVALLSGSGTAANETALRAAVRPGHRLAVVVNGVYGERLAETARRAGIETVHITADWTTPVTATQVALALLTEEGVDAVAVVHHETTTGLLNPVEAIAEAAHGSGAVVLVDAISSFGAEELDCETLDFVTCTSNKCLHGLAGAAFVLVSPRGTRRARETEPTSVYLDLCAYLDAALDHSPPFTPALPALASLAQAFDELFVEGVEARRQTYVERAALLDELLDRLGLEQLVAPEHRSHSIRSVRLPPDRSFAALHAPLREAGFVVYAGQGALAREIFRVACMGALTRRDLDEFGAALTAYAG